MDFFSPRFSPPKLPPRRHRGQPHLTAANGLLQAKAIEPTEVEENVEKADDSPSFLANEVVYEVFLGSSISFSYVFGFIFFGGGGFFGKIV